MERYCALRQIVRPKFHTPLCVQGTSHLALVCLYLHVHNRTHIFIKYIDTLRAKLLYQYTIKISIVKSHCSSSITSKAIQQAFKMERSRGGLSWLMWKQMDQKSDFFLVAIWQVRPPCLGASGLIWVLPGCPGILVSLHCHTVLEKFMLLT